MSKKTLDMALAAIACVALAVRTVLAVRCAAIPDFSDMALYNDAARAHGFPTSLPPGYPLFLRAVYALFGGGNYRAVFVVQGIISSITVLLMYRIASTVSGRKAGLIAAAIAAVYPNLIVYNLTTLTETIGVFFVCALLAILVGSADEKRKSIYAAVVLSLAFLFRPVILFFAPGVFAGLKRRWTFALAAIVLIVPLISYEMIIGKSFQRGAVALYEAYYPSLDGSHFIDPLDTELGSGDLPSVAYLRAALRYIKSDKVKMVENIYNKGAVVFSRGWDFFVMRPIVGDGRAVDYLMKYAYLPVMVLGFIGMVRLYGGGNKSLALPALSYLVFVIVFSLFKFRYRLLVEPVLIIYAAMLCSRGFFNASAAPGAERC